MNLSDILPALPALLGSAFVGGLFTYLIAYQQLSLQRRMEATQSFLQICAHAHGYPHDDRGQRVGLAEQLAAIEMVRGLANKYRFLRQPARAALEAMDVTYRDIDWASSVVANAAATARTGVRGTPWSEAAPIPART